MKALSIRAPWWWLILHAGKDIENRDWPTRFRGRVLIHASKYWRFEEFQDDWDAGAYCYRAAGGEPKEFETTPRQIKDSGGCIVGSVEIVDCVTDSESPWFMGKHGFVLRNPVAFEIPIPFKGALGLFEGPSVSEPESGEQSK